MYIWNNESALCADMKIKKKNNTEIKIKQLIERNQNYETNKNRTILSSQLSFTLFDIEFWINTAFIDVSEYSVINGKF